MQSACSFFFTHELQSCSSCLLRSVAETLHNNFPGAALNLLEQFQLVEGENPFGSMCSKPSVQLAAVGGRCGEGVQVGKRALATRRGPGFELHSVNSQAVLAKVRHGEKGESMTSPKISNCAVNYSVFTADNLGPPRVRQFSPSSPAADETPPLPPLPHSYRYSNN